MTLPKHHATAVNRRRFLSITGAMPVTALLTASALPAQAGAASTEFKYEITRSDEDWRARLTEEEYVILRHGGTEMPHSSLNAFQMDDGHYTCKGCDLANFDARWKVAHFDIGWAFFSQARPNTILTSIDDRGSDMDASQSNAAIECHCRRCASHFGHILTVKGQTLHCLNGSSLVFHAA